MGEELEEQVTCWICFEIFKEPVTLNCTHSFCQECLIKLSKRNAECAFCRRPFRPPLPAVSKALELLVVRFKNAGAPVPAAPRNAQSALIFRIPDEIFIEIMGMLDVVSLARAACVCKDLRRLSEDSIIWRELCKRRFPFCRPQKYNNDWKRCFVGTRRLQRGWNEGKPSDFNMTALRGHSDYVSCFSFYRSNVVSGSADNTLKVWSVNKEDALHTLSGHNALINAVEFNETRILSAAADATVRVWDTVTGAAQQTMHHNRAVNCLAGHGDAMLVAGSDDGAVKLWDSRVGTSVRTFQHGSAVRKVIFDDGNRIIAAGWDNLRVWDAGSGQCQYVFPASTHVSVVKGNRLAAVQNANVMVYSLVNGSTLASLNNQHVGITCMDADDERCVVGGADNSVRVFDMRRYSPAYVLRGHSAPITCVQLDVQKIVSGSDDNSLKVWELSQGRGLYSLLGGTQQRRGNNPRIRHILAALV